MMRDYLEPMLGTTGALIAQFAITLAVLLVLILIVFWLIRRFSNGRFGVGSARGRQPRLAIVDALPVDSRRRLILVRRDNVEHLIMIGGPSDLVVEASVVRGPPQNRRMEPQRNAPPPPPSQVRPEPSRPAPEPQRRPEPAIVQPEIDLPPRVLPPAPVMNDTASTDTFFATVAQSEAVVETPPAAPPPRQPVQARRSSSIPSFISSVRGRQTPTIPPEEPAPERMRPDQRQSPRPEPRQESRRGPGYESRQDLIAESRQEARQELPRLALRPEEVPRPAIRPDPVETRRVGPRSRPIETPRSMANLAPSPGIDQSAALRDDESELPTPDAAQPAVIRENPLMSATSRQPALPIGGLSALPDDFPPYEPIFTIDSDDAPSPVAREEPVASRPVFSGLAPAVNPPEPEDAPSAIEAEERIEPVMAREPETDESPVGDLEREMARLLGEISSTRK